jgi:hypothetical protein
MIVRPINRFFAGLIGAAFAIFLQVTASAAGVVRVTLQVDNSTLKVGNSTTLHVKAQITPDQQTNTVQIVTWYVDLLDSASSAVQIQPGTVVVPVADSDPSTSSKGTLSGNLRAVYDTFFNTSNAGHDAAVELFSVQIKAVAVGAATFSIAAGSGAPALDQDFTVLTTTGDPLFGGLYDTATVQVTSFNNVPPTIDPITNATINEGARISLTAVGHDADVGQTLRYSLVGAAPTGLTLDAITGALNWTPAENQGPGVYTFKIKVADNGTPAMSATNQFDITVNEVNTAPSLQVPATINAVELQPINATCIATDPDILPGKTPSTNRLTFSLVNPPAGATIDANTGAFAWTPTEAQGPGSYSVKVVVVDDGIPPMAATNGFTINVSEQNLPPSITAPANQIIAEGASLNVAFVAADPDIPANQLTFSVVSAPPGVVLDSNSGLVAWTPTEAQGPGSYTVRVRVSDNAPTPLFATNSMQVTVSEVNAAPVLDLLPDRTVTELTPLAFTVLAHDTDLPAQTLTFSLDTPPTGASISSTTGAFTWTPTEAQGPGRYTITVRVTDSGSPARSDTKSFDVVVNEQNTAPILTTPAGQGAQTVPELSPVSIQFTATDGDVPANLITFSLQNAPTGATIDAASGLFSWTPSETQGPGIYPIKIIATDNGAPPLSTTNAITLTVTEVSAPPIIDPIESQTVDEMTKLTLQIAAHDSDLPAQFLTYALLVAPAGAAIDSATGVFTWTPTEAQGPGQYSVTVQVTDHLQNGGPGVSSSKTFSISVNEVNVAPAFPNPIPITLAELTPMNARVTATDADILNGQAPSTNKITYSLLDAPPGMTINPQTAALSWTPTEAQGPGSYQVRVAAVDDGLPPLSSTTTLTVNVTEANRAPSIAAPAAQTIPELAPFAATFAATDPDLPANTLTFRLVSAPSGVQINAGTGVISWTPTEVQGPGAYTISVAVSDDGSPSLSATNSMNVTVTEVNSKPALAPIPDFVLSKDTTLNFTAIATDPDSPAQTLTFSLDSAPPGASVNPSTGVFVWTPTAAQSGLQYIIVMRVTESGAAALFDTKSFTISISGLPNTAPTILSPPDQTIAVGATLTVTNIATDVDIPLNTLTFALATAPAGATINPSTGVFTWTPNASQVGKTQIRVKVTDNGVPGMSATNSFFVTVTGGGGGPQATLRLISVQAAGTTLRVEGPTGSSYDLEYSVDFLSWAPLTTVSLGGQTFATYLDVAHGFGQQRGFYRAKSAGSVNPSAPTITPKSLGPGGFALRVTGDIGATYRIQFSTDFINWSPVGSVTLAGVITADFVDAAQGTRGPKGFYRAIFP